MTPTRGGPPPGPAAGRPHRILMRAVHDALWAAREPERANRQQQYMHSRMPFMGVRVPVMRRTARDACKRHPPSSADNWMATVLALWREAAYREQRYAAVELAVHPQCLRWLTTGAIGMLDEIVVDGAWWDYVDRIAPAGFGHLLGAEPQATSALLREWARDDNIWRRRSAILGQIKRKGDTDPALLYDCLTPSFGHPEFFVRKAMGWALRAHAYTDPDAVRRYVADNGHRLSKLTRREALRNVGRTTNGA